MHFPMAARHINRGDSCLATAILVAPTKGNGYCASSSFTTMARAETHGTHFYQHILIACAGTGTGHGELQLPQTPKRRF